eukprot:GHVT01005305.1.p1 GENE.GHVT01005305.1~~GHVT01005305.1.p1  ORF type:complete len:222 (+),score=30.50 GHVT01005305.1:179-844(+)
MWIPEKWLVYLENDYVTIEGYNVRASTNTSATVLGKLKVTFKNSGVIYSANDGVLADKFDNSASAGAEDIPKINLNGKAVKLQLRKAGILIRLTTYKKKNMFSVLLVRLSQSVAEASTGVLIDGCIADELNITQTDDGSRRKRDTCDTTCEDAGNEATCLFDCIATGDPELAKASDTDLKEAETSATEEDEDLSGEDPNAAAVPGMSILVALAAAMVTLLY